MRPIQMENSRKIVSQYNNFHDAVITKISFLKDREMDSSDGSVIVSYRVEDQVNTTNVSSLCTVEIDILHSNYNERMSKHDAFKIILTNVTEFSFNQTGTEDYSVIYDLSISDEGFIYCKTDKSRENLVVKCKNMEIIRKYER